MPARDYRDLIAWRKAFDLAVSIHKETAMFPMDQRYGFTSQLRRAGVSIPSNIAEGKGRNPKEFRRYLRIALGSVKEAETQILISDRLGYFRQGQAAVLLGSASEVSRLIHGLSRSLRPM